MPVKKVEIKVDVNCEKCKYAIMGAVTELEGVNQVSLDHEKQLLTVVGTMDAVCIAEHLKKIKQKPIIVTLGAPKPPEVKPPQCHCIPPCCNRIPPSCYRIPTSCNRIPPSCPSRDFVSVDIYDKSGCTIL